MTIISSVTLSKLRRRASTISHYNGMDYVYLLEGTSTAVRYMVIDGHFYFDESWQPPAVANCGSSPAARSSS